MDQGSRWYDRAFVLTGQVGAGWAMAMATDLVAGLNEIGIAAELLAVETVVPDDPRLAHQNFYVVDFNHRLRWTPPAAPRFSIMVDHPCTRLADLADARPDLDVLGWVDDSHPAAAAALGIGLPSHFVPHGGPRPVARPAAFADRDIDIVFAGSLAEPVDRLQWIADTGVLPNLGAAIFDAVDAMGERLQPALEAFVEACRAHAIDIAQFSRDAFCQAVTIVINHAEINHRNAVLAALPARAKVVVVSDHLPTALRGHDNIGHRGWTEDFAAIRGLFARAKIVLNTTNKFPCGAHERIWYGMAEGAAILTDPSSFLDRDFVDGDTMLFLPRGGITSGSLDRVAALLDRPDRLAELAAAADPVYWKGHTWASRARVIDAAIQAV